MIKDVMSSFRLHLISRIRPALSQYASRFFHDLTDGKYPEMELDDHYNIYIYDNGKKYPIQRFSGGEIDLANLCLRLAISDVITERAEGLFHFIILDEIFGSQDRLRQQNIMQELYKLSSTYKQIFLITHVEDVKHFMQHIIKVDDLDGESIISIN
jgi:exonuclease SbcC